MPKGSPTPFLTTLFKTSINSVENIIIIAHFSRNLRLESEGHWSVTVHAESKRNSILKPIKI